MNDDRFDDRTLQAADILASLSPYSPEEARLIIAAIARCLPADVIVDLLLCSPKNESTKQ